MGVPDRQSLRARYGDEQVLVAKAASLQHLPTGISAISDLTTLLSVTSYRPRWQVEYDPTWRQFVCYIVLRRNRELYLTERLQAQGEARLHSLFSLGVGGHINRMDGTEPLQSGWRRELSEELSLSWSPLEVLPQALINDLSNPVSQDHLGVLYLVDIPADGQVAVRETNKMRGQLVALDTIATEIWPRLESWSQLVVDFLQKAQQ